MRPTVRAIEVIAIAALLLLAAAGAARAVPENFPVRALDNILAAEGGCSGDRHDPGNAGGGVTLNGIIQRVYDAHRDGEGLERKRLTCAMAGTREWIAERNAIYRARYWEPCAGPSLPLGLDGQVASMCVNSGITRGWSMLMGVLELETQRPYAPLREVLGEIARRGVRAVIIRYGEARRAFYRSIAPRTGGRFLNGWLTRETRERNAALAQAAGTRTGASVAALPAGVRMGKAVEDADVLLEVMP